MWYSGQTIGYALKGKIDKVNVNKYCWHHILVIRKKFYAIRHNTWLRRWYRRQHVARAPASKSTGKQDRRFPTSLFNMCNNGQYVILRIIKCDPWAIRRAVKIVQFDSHSYQTKLGACHGQGSRFNKRVVLLRRSCPATAFTNYKLQTLRHVESGSDGLNGSGGRIINITTNNTTIALTTTALLLLS